MSREIPRRFTLQEDLWMREVAPHMIQSQVARELEVRVTAVNNWAFRNRVKFFGSRRGLRKLKKPVIPAKPVVRETQDVDRLMKLVERARGVA